MGTGRGVSDRDRPRRASPRNGSGYSILRLNWLGSLGVIKSRREALALNIKFHLATLGCNALRALGSCAAFPRARGVALPINPPLFLFPDGAD